MTIQMKTEVLRQHSIVTMERQDGRLMARDEFLTPDSVMHYDWTDVTDFTKSDLYGWLGY